MNKKEYLDQKAREEGFIAVDLMNPIMEAFIQKFNESPKREPRLMMKLVMTISEESKQLSSR